MPVTWVHLRKLLAHPGMPLLHGERIVFQRLHNGASLRRVLPSQLGAGLEVWKHHTCVSRLSKRRCRMVRMVLGNAHSLGRRPMSDLRSHAHPCSGVLVHAPLVPDSELVGWKTWTARRCIVDMRTGVHWVANRLVVLHIMRCAVLAGRSEILRSAPSSRQLRAAATRVCRRFSTLRPLPTVGAECTSASTGRNQSLASCHQRRPPSRGGAGS
mmetsp:Transcript_60613/g.162596  ORF Transcript_60613/g.162596 Transcript_60613/m.162596 type:complete len:213 (-) Transcript_60613:438-1076(-)